MQTREPVAFVLTDGPPRLRRRTSKVGFIGDDVGGAVTQALGLDKDDLGIVGKQIEQNVLAIDEPRQPRLHAVEGQPFGETLPLLAAPGLTGDETVGARPYLVAGQELAARKDQRALEGRGRALVVDRELTETVD